MHVGQFEVLLAELGPNQAEKWFQTWSNVWLCVWGKKKKVLFYYLYIQYWCMFETTSAM